MNRVLNYPDVTIGALPPSTAQMYGDRLAVVDGDRSLTFSQLDTQSAQVAAGLRGRGVTDGDVVAIHLNNSIDFVLAYYGSIRAGATLAMINPLQPTSGLRGQLDEIGASVVFTATTYLDRLLDAVHPERRCTVVVADGTPGASSGDIIGLTELLSPGLVAAEATADGIVPAHPAADDVVHLAFTGGTTGVSKAVRILHRNLVANITQMTAWRAGNEVDVDDDGLLSLKARDNRSWAVIPGEGASIVVSPLFHAQALINMSFLLLCGVTNVFAGRFDPATTLGLIERHHATYVTGSPTMWHALVEHADVSSPDLDSVRVVSSGAAPLDRGLLDDLRRTFPQAAIVEGYGMTEATNQVSSTPLYAGAEHRLGSVGLPTYDTVVEIRATDPATSPLGPGEVGEIWVRGPQVAAGYLNNPALTSEQFVDGWLATGDIGYRDEEGYLYVSDRAKDMLIYKGYNVYPRELEEVLLQHPDVAAAAVVGRDAGAVGQEPVAFVVPTAGRTVDPEEIMRFVSEQVLPYKKVRDVVLMDALPVTAAGKLQKAELRRGLAV